jgi:glycosyltransferase involved in cell wall biosynthesis
MAEELGRNGREYIVREFSRRRSAEKYIRELERLLNLPQSRVAEVAA